MEAAGRLGRRAIGRPGLHVGDAARTWHPPDLLAHAGHDRLRFTPSARLRATRRILPASPFTTLPIRIAQSGFDQIDYEAIQHIPILRDSWVVSLRGWAQTTYGKAAQQIPFFMMPSIGGRVGPARLRQLAAARPEQPRPASRMARDRQPLRRHGRSFYDAGRVAAKKRTDLTLDDMKSDVGLGNFRLHSPIATPLRIEFTHGREGFALVLAASEVF